MCRFRVFCLDWLWCFGFGSYCVVELEVGFESVLELKQCWFVFVFGGGRNGVMVFVSLF